MAWIAVVAFMAFGAFVWEQLRKAEWFPWESEKVKALRLERDGYKQRLDDVVDGIDAEKDVLAMLEARGWAVIRDTREAGYYSRLSYMTLGYKPGPEADKGWRVGDQWHKTLLGAYRKAVIAHKANEALKEELGKVE